MLVTDGGGGGTDWASMSIEMMHALIVNPDIEAHYRLLTGWQRSFELVSEHMTQMINYRDNLAAAWPPEKSAASAAYLAQLDHLIVNLDATCQASMANYDAFAAATLSISSTQHAFQEIWNEHEANRAKLAEYQNDLAMSSAATFDTTPPVTSMRQEAIRRKAIALMSSVSSDLAQAQIRISRPSPYEASTHSEDETKPFNGSSYSAPRIPPITPIYVARNSSRDSSAQPSFSVDSGSKSGGADGPQSALPSNGHKQPGLILGGATSPIDPSFPIGSSPGSHPIYSDSAAASVVNPILPPKAGSATSYFDQSERPSAGPPIRGVSNEKAARPGSSLRDAGRPMATEGLIGGTPAVDLGQPGSGRPINRRVNPIGGVIGDGEANSRIGSQGSAQSGSEVVTGGLGASSPTRGTGRPAPSAARMKGAKRPDSLRTSSDHSYGRVDGRRPSRRDESAASRWDPDNPWKTAEGVDPVLLPPRERRIDPGPAIGLN